MQQARPDIKQKPQHRKLKRRTTAKYWTLAYAKIHKNTIRHTPSYKQLEVKTKWTSILCEIVTDTTKRN